MPIELFISYRRSDAAGHARALHRDLKEHFDAEALFFDRESIESGDLFPQRIADSVSQSLVVLVLVGPDWLLARQGEMRRLDNPTDFVRREVAMALAGGQTVIPVLFDDTPPPQATDLPDELAGLSLRDMLQLRGKTLDYDTQLRELVRLVSRAGVTPAASQRGGRGTGATAVEPGKLVILCNRSQQENDTRDLLHLQLRQVQRRPFAIVVHGPVEEVHHEFVARIEGFSLPAVLKGKALAPGVRFVRFTDLVPVESAERFARSVRLKLADELGADTLDDDRALLKVLEQQKIGALVAVLSWRASEITGDPQLPLRRLFDYLGGFPDLGSKLLLGCIVCIKYDQAAGGGGGWLKRMFAKGGDSAQALRAAIAQSEVSYSADARVAWRLLPELPRVRVADLDRWVEEVERLLGRRLGVTERDLHRIIEGESQPMQDVLPQLEKLVPQA